jgi:protein-S-isoprenylcysteine O-methyltransferase Ste14
MLIFKTLLFTLIAPCTVTVAVPYLLLRWRSESFPQTWNIFSFIGLFICVAGVAIYGWCARDFILKGKGTPAPYDPPKQLVAEGFYRLSRNPMYVGVSSIVLGEALFFKSLAVFVYTLVLFCAFHLRVTLYEEPTLKRLFGESFAEYCRRVPRWLPVEKIFSGKRIDSVR